MRRKTFKTYCPKCEYKIVYQPLPGFKGEFRCPTCGHEFKIPTLLDYNKPEVIESFQHGQVVPVSAKRFGLVR